MDKYSGYSANDKDGRSADLRPGDVSRPAQHVAPPVGAKEVESTSDADYYSGYPRLSEAQADLATPQAAVEDDASALRWRSVLLRLTEVLLSSARTHDSLAPILTTALNHAIERLLIYGDDADLMALEEWLEKHDEPDARTAMPPLCILLVDDSIAFLESAARFLAADERVQIAGWASSGREALDLVQRLHPDLVLMDLAMPDMNGLDATRAIKSGPNAPLVVIVTMHDNPEGREAAQMVRADGFVAKPQFCSELPLLLDRLCA